MGGGEDSRTLPTRTKAGLIASVTRLVNQPFIAWLILQPMSIHPHSCTLPGGGDGVAGEGGDCCTDGSQVTCGDGARPTEGDGPGMGVGAGAA
ncbi:hypothetical protein DMB42_22140 [Nonomuraea sp. WAC 01424]|nr:hypothetical protein DMB42_22140 [Nonomuraea sp. WAC 01424]